MKRLLFFCLLVNLLGSSVQAQMLHGYILDEKDHPLIGATVSWKNSPVGTVTDAEGHFQIDLIEETQTLVLQYIGYHTQTFEVTNTENDLVFTLLPESLDLEAVEVTGHQHDNFVSVLDTRQVETISSQELRKAACCSLAESFETNASVDVSYSDAVTGAKEIQMLGLRGIYTQLLIEKRPALSGLGTGHSMEYIPGTWLESIQIAKGAGSVQNGYQSITGQINAELKKPWEDRALFANLYLNPMGRGELNVHLNKQLTDEWSTGLLLHGSMTRNTIDHDGDNFVDMPNKELVTGMYRLFYRGDKIRGQFNVHALRHQTQSGQLADFFPEDYSFPLYQINQRSERVELFGKMGYLGLQDPNATMGLILNAAWHELNATYGNTTHQGIQHNGYANFLYSKAFGTELGQQLNLGANYLFDNFQESLNDTDYGRMESVPGAFAEYVYKKERYNKETEQSYDQINLILGARVDQHNLYGTLFTPRLNFKYGFSEKSVFRISAGRGFRRPNVIAENVGMLASSRAVELLEDIQLEEAWNFGLNFVQEFKVAARDWSLSLDFYRTEFVNQLIVDFEEDVSRVLLYNLDGQSFSNSGLAMLNMEIAKGLDLKLAYKFNDVQATFSGELRERPLVAKHRGLVTLDYTSPLKEWMFNISTQIVGPQRLIDDSQFPEAIVERFPERSPTYALLNAQVTRSFFNWEIYVGGENLTNFRQHLPIISYGNPFGPYFNANQIYAPIMGTQVYLGLRFWLN